MAFPSSPANGQRYEDFKFDTVIGAWDLIPEYAGASAKDLIDNFPYIEGSDGWYWIKPEGYSGDPYKVWCDMTGIESGIGTPGWMKVEYEQDYYTELAPWGNLGVDAHIDFSLKLSNTQIQAMLDSASESRQIFQSPANSSVGWTNYSGGLYMSGHLFDGTRTSSIVPFTFAPTVDWSFAGWDSDGILLPQGSDPTSINDAVWRDSTIYLVDSSAKCLPIVGITHGDADSVGENRYFPFLSGVGSHTWIK